MDNRDWSAAGTSAEPPAGPSPPAGFWRKARANLDRVPFLEDAVAAYYCAIDPGTPAAVKAALVGVLVYFVLPFDLIPDVLLGVGFTDDAAVIAGVIAAMRRHMTAGHYAPRPGLAEGGPGRFVGVRVLPSVGLGTAQFREYQMPMGLRFFARSAAAVCVVFVLVSGALPAGGEQWIATFGEWNAFQTADGPNRVCYISSTPLDMEPRSMRRGPAYVRVTSRGTAGDAVAIAPGYAFEGEGTVAVTVDAAEFRLRPGPDGAVSPGPAQDAAMVRAMVAGTRMIVRANPGKGATSTDTYSLTGFTAAHNAMNAACRSAP